jgi:alkylation response protein AidB-like acyl-CoA dehydrogenase
MRFHLSEDQRVVQRTAKELLESRSPWAKVREHAEAGRYDDALWRELCELGWPGIAIAEEHGGQGLGSVELAVLLEELGAACAVTPFLGSVLAAGAIEAAGSDAQKERWLPGLASGELRGALGSPGALVADADGADVVIAVDEAARTASLLEGSAVEAVTAIDPTRRFARIAQTDGEPLPGDTGAAIDRALVAISADLVGLCRRALEMTVEYVKDRKQFGVPVGSFQAVQHRAAQMLLDTEGARATTLFAAWTADAAAERLPMAAAMAKAWSSDAGRSVTGAAIQLHGGIGFTWEADVHWLYKRAQLDAALLGGGGAHRARVAQLHAGRADAVPA